MEPMRNPIIVALDVSSAERALDLAGQLAPAVGAFKIGSELFTRAGPEIVRQVRALGAPVFLDLKFHDIPNTVARAVAAALQLDVQMLTVHTAGGPAMLAAAEKAAQESAVGLGCPPPLVLGVTVLTSLDDAALRQLGMACTVAEQVQRLGQMAAQAGLRGLVCSPLEIVGLRSVLPRCIQLVTPGIRLAEAARDDQKRTLSAKAALVAGADWLVIGRPICAAQNPRAAAEGILRELAPGG
jgi:orotidine-5'-phosphate decarboxylase